MNILKKLMGICLGFVFFSAVANASVSWEEVGWDVYGSGSASVNGSGSLLLNPTSSAELGVHVNRLPVMAGGTSINASGTPWIRFSYYDTGSSNDKIEMLVDDEINLGTVSVGSLWSATKVMALRYGPGPSSSRPEGYMFFSSLETTPSAPDRANILHDVLIGKLADGTVWAKFDDIVRSSSFIKDGIGAFDFNDVYLRIRGASAGSTITFNSFQFGDNFSPSMIPAPGAIVLGMLGMGLVGWVKRRWA